LDESSGFDEATIWTQVKFENSICQKFQFCSKNVFTQFSILPKTDFFVQNFKFGQKFFCQIVNFVQNLLLYFQFCRILNFAVFLILPYFQFFQILPYFQFCQIFNFAVFSIFPNFQFCRIFNFAEFSILQNFQFCRIFNFAEFSILSKMVFSGKFQFSRVFAEFLNFSISKFSVLDTQF